MRTNLLDLICGLVLIFGAINLGVLGLVELNAIEVALEPVFQPAALEAVTRSIYVLVGLAGLYYVYPVYKMAGDFRRSSSTSR